MLKRILTTTTSFVLFATPFLAIAQGCAGLKDCATQRTKAIGDKAFGALTESSTPYDIIGGIILFALGLVGIIFVIIILQGGFLWMTAGGNEKQVTDAKAKLYNGIIGAVVVFAAYLLTSAVLGELCDLTGVNCF